MKVEYPKVYLVLDNCFAIKRWVEPSEWMAVIKNIGFKYIEASFDNEMDMLYSPKEYCEKWFDDLEKEEARQGLKVVNFYTGYQTYRTSGLAHPNEVYVNNLIENWFKPAINHLSERNNGLGFSFHGIPEKDLSNAELFHNKENQVKKKLIEISEYAQKKGESQISIEAMYAPHQTPWTLKGAEKYLNYHENLNISIDVGHMIGQRKYLFPDFETVEESLLNRVPTAELKDFVLPVQLDGEWNKIIDNVLISKENVADFYKELKEYSYLFADSLEDSDPYSWLTKFGGYSPIIHLQQTDGITASHKPFTEKTNKAGIIHPLKVLKALKQSYDNPNPNIKSRKSKNIYLTFEIFASNTDSSREIIDGLTETLKYWREFIPEDGVYLDEILNE